jgi:hypothetical protein
LYNRIAPVRAYTKVEIGLEFLVRNRVLDFQFLVVEIGLNDLVVEEEANIIRGCRFFQQAFIKKRTANGVDALEGKERGRAQQKVISRPVYGHAKVEHSPVHPYHTTGCPARPTGNGSCVHAWEWHLAETGLPQLDLSLPTQQSLGVIWPS